MPADKELQGPDRAGAPNSQGGAVRTAFGSFIPVVGIGASAGGIQAFSEFLAAMPVDSGAAFVFVLHLDPTKESQLAAVLQYHTSMPVVEIEDEMVVLPNQVYVIAPNRDLTLDGDRLRLTEPNLPRGHRHPVDVLFKSLAEQRAERSVAIILSGTGTNGTQGIKEVRAAGGLILVQEPRSASFDGMSRSAISSGLVDYVLPAAEMPAILMRYLQHGYLEAPDGLATSLDRNKQTGLEQILAVLRAHSGLEFRSYKPATLLRRINRRMSLGNIADLTSYLAVLREKPGEIQALVKDMLINVTSFFRDGEAWATLDEAVISRLAADRETGASIRIWVPACASGEEAYSIAMLLIEHAEALNKVFDTKVFASDILDENLNVARAGVYPGASVELMPPERIRRFFEKLDGSYQVTKQLRDMVVFARHDLLRDPPFSRMDLITCRNMLIYVEPEAQRRVLSLFQFALREGGRLFLGSAETIGRADDLFETISKKWRIYRKIGPTRHDIVNFPTVGGQAAGQHRPEVVPFNEPSVRITEIARRVLLDRFAPASVLIDQSGRVLYFHGETGDYLKQPSGEPTRDLLVMARGGLVTKLRAAIHTVTKGNQEVSFNAQIRELGASSAVLVTVTALPPSQHASGLMLVTFKPGLHKIPAAAREIEVELRSEPDATLEGELRSTRSELRGTIEQLESVNEELKASNEEATSMNEELQSSNEELETSKEELQSFNEELHSVNSQLQHKISELDETGNDLSNLLSATEIATIFLDTTLRIKWFSPATKQLMDLESSDIGRPVSHFARKFADNQLLTDAEIVLASLIPIDAVVQSNDHKWFIRRVQPYRTRDNRIAGLVISFVDITERKQAGDHIDEARIYAEAIVSTVRQPLVVLDAKLQVRSANLAFYALFGLSGAAAEGNTLYALGGGEWDNPALRALLEEVLSENKWVQDVELLFGPDGIGQRCMLLNARKLLRNGGREGLILLAIEEITEQKQMAMHQEMLIGELNHRVKNVLATVQAVMSQTFRQAASLDDFQVAFEGRLHALAQAHNLLADKEWIGAEIGQLVEQTLAPYHATANDRIILDGPKVTIRPQSGVALVMILHELATNAAKYGALSSPHGELAVSWHCDGENGQEQIQIKWRETKGPKVNPPSRRGFGTKLIERSMSYELGGKAELQYLETGLHCDLKFPVQADARTAAEGS